MPRIIQGKILAEGARRAAVLLDFPDHGVGVGCLLGRVGMVDRQPCAGARQGESDSPADFPTRTGDQSGAAAQAELVERV